MDASGIYRCVMMEWFGLESSRREVFLYLSSCMYHDNAPLTSVLANVEGRVTRRLHSD